MIDYILLIIFVVLVIINSIWIISIIMSKKFLNEKYTPHVSIIIPAHNEEKYIRKTLESIINDAYPNKEIIVIDDGSTDRTGNIVSSFSNVKLLRTNHVGKSNALNKGLSHAKHDIVVIIDADSEIKKGSIENLVKPLKDRHIGATTGVIRARINSNPLTWFQDYEYIMSSGWRYASTNLNGNSVVPGLAAFRKDIIKKIGGFSKDTLTEDFDIVVSLSKKGFGAATVKNACIITNVPQSFRALIKQRLRWGRGTLQVIKKHFKFIFSKKSGPMGYFTIPTQFYWYVHAMIYLPLTIYLVFIVWSKNIVITSGIFSLEFLVYLLKLFSVYGIIDLVIKVITYEYTFTILIFFSILSFTLSLLYTLTIFKKLTRPNISILFVYVFFFPYSLFNLFILLLSAVQMAYRPIKENIWE